MPAAHLQAVSSGHERGGRGPRRRRLLLPLRQGAAHTAVARHHTGSLPSGVMRAEHAGCPGVLIPRADMPFTLTIGRRRERRAPSPTQLSRLASWALQLWSFSSCPRQSLSCAAGCWGSSGLRSTSDGSLAEACCVCSETFFRSEPFVVAVLPLGPSFIGMRRRARECQGSGGCRGVSAVHYLLMFSNIVQLAMAL